MLDRTRTTPTRSSAPDNQETVVTNGQPVKTVKSSHCKEIMLGTMLHQEKTTSKTSAATLVAVSTTDAPQLQQQMTSLFPEDPRLEVVSPSNLLRKTGTTDRLIISRQQPEPPELSKARRLIALTQPYGNQQREATKQNDMSSFPDHLWLLQILLILGNKSGSDKISTKDQEEDLDMLHQPIHGSWLDRQRSRIKAFLEQNFELDQRTLNVWNISTPDRHGNLQTPGHSKRIGPQRMDNKAPPVDTPGRSYPCQFLPTYIQNGTTTMIHLNW